jgi:hypothetical protein
VPDKSPKFDLGEFISGVISVAFWALIVFFGGHSLLSHPSTAKSTEFTTPSSTPTDESTYNTNSSSDETTTDSTDYSTYSNDYPATDDSSNQEDSNLSNDNYYTNTYGDTVHSPAYSDSVPSGATAQCNDGTYSFSESHRGACSYHGGVATWL